MHHEPVKVQAHFYRIFTKDGQFIRETGVTYTVQARLLGTTPVMTSKGPKELPYIECGHKHKTKAAAEPCLKRLKKQYEELRSKLALKAAEKARVTRAQKLVDRFHASTPALLPFVEQKRKSLLPVEPIIRKSLV